MDIALFPHVNSNLRGQRFLILSDLRYTTIGFIKKNTLINNGINVHFINGLNDMICVWNLKVKRVTGLPFSFLTSSDKNVFRKSKSCKVKIAVSIFVLKII